MNYFLSSIFNEIFLRANEDIKLILSMVKTEGSTSIMTCQPPLNFDMNNSSNFSSTSSVESFDDSNDEEFVHSTAFNSPHSYESFDSIDGPDFSLENDFIQDIMLDQLY